MSGIDPSPVMLRQARKRNAGGIKAGRIEFREGSVAALPYDDGSFDKVLSVNNIMLWPGPGESLREVRRVMKPGGCLVIALSAVWPAKTFKDVEDIGQEIAMHVSGAGFVHTDTEIRKLKPVSAVIVTAVVPGF